MLSDEEREAIEYLKSRLYGNEGCKFIDVAQIDLRIFLNIIEKQSKEIEELKDKNKKLQDKAIELIFEKQELTSALLDSTPNDKIKAKIEEVGQWELYNMKIPRLSTLDERLGAKIGIKYVLQSLLEKE